MLVREYSDADYQQVHRLHAKGGLGYTLPPLPREEFYSRRVVEDHGAVAMAAFMRLTSEVYLIPDPSWRNPAWRMEALRQLQAVCVGDAREQGVKEICGFLPPVLVKKFGRRLTRMGWSSYKGEEWKCYGLGVE